MASQVSRNSFFKPICKSTPKCALLETKTTKKLVKFLSKYKVLKVVQILCAIYIAYMTFTQLRDPETGWILDTESQERTERGVILDNGVERAIVAINTFQLICLTITRISAYLMYPALVLVYLTKLRATMSLLQNAPIGMFLVADTHKLHVYCGWTIFIDGTLHSCLHTTRWINQGNGELLWTHFSGISGIIIFTSLLLVSIPMMFQSLRRKMKYEIRKNTHYLFLAFALGLCFHSKAKGIPNGGFSPYVFGILLVWFFLDSFYCHFFMSEKIDTTQFTVLPNGVQIKMKVSDAFQNRVEGGYCYICLPWIAKTQWHAFSLFGNPSDPSERLIYVQRGGDWTEKVHDILQRDTVRPAWVAGPFASPYSNANNYDNQILVASGIGITPALDVMRAQKAKRRVNLIWACRDRHLIMFFVRHVAFDQDGWNLIFYSGKDELPEEDKEFLSKVNVCLVKGRPKLSKVIPNIVHGIESGRGLPEQYYEANGKSEMNHTARTVSSSKPTHFNDDLMDVEKIQQELKEKEDEIVRLRKLLNVHLGNLNSLDTMQDSKAQFEEVDDDGSVEDTEIPLSPSDRPKQGSNLKNAEKRNPSRNVSLKSFRSASSVDELKQSINKQRTELEQKLKKMKTSFRSKDNDSANDGFSIGNSDFEPLSDDIIEEGGTGADILIPWEHDEGPKYVTNLCSEKVLSTWGLLYCGGSNKIKDHLKQVSEHYDIDLYVECFDW